MSVPIIIKTLNETKGLAATLESVLAAKQPEDEVIVSDSEPTDGTIGIARGYPVTLVQIAPGQQSSCGLGPQLDCQYSAGDYLCLMDGDIKLDPAFLVQAVPFLEANPAIAGVGGRVVEMNLENLEFARCMSRGGAEYRTGAIDRLNGGRALQAGCHRRPGLSVGLQSARLLGI
ncbi:MAG: glycosyltransferase [Candidatus Devosia euplotis]|nr:glycosyltransferase [Candidatus Devosia euplotis]